MKLTTNHPTSCHGIPVLVDGDGNAYGPEDRLPVTGQLASDYVRSAERGLAPLDLSDAPGFDPVDLLGAWADEFTRSFRIHSTAN